jgi:hypothetical protein
MLLMTRLVVTMMTTATTSVSISEATSTSAVSVAIIAILVMSGRRGRARIRWILRRGIMDCSGIMGIWLAVTTGWWHGFMLKTRAHEAI